MTAKAKIGTDEPDRNGDAYTIDELRVVLSRAIDDITADRSTASKVNAISNAAGKILNTLKLQIEYQQMTGRHGTIAMLEEAS